MLDYVFTSIHDEKMTKRKLSEYLNKFKAHYGITDKWMYFDLRHSFAHNFMQSGGSLEKLREMLGLRSQQTLEVVYTKRPVTRTEVSSPYES